MRLLRALVNVVLMLVVLGAATAESANPHPVAARGHGAQAAMPCAEHGEHSAAVHAAHPAASPATGSEEGTPSIVPAAHDPSTCRAACCSAPVQPPTQPTAESTTADHGAVRYAGLVRSPSGRTCEPEPGVPRRAA